MASPSSHGVTRLLKAWSGGEQQALGQLVPLVYHELHRLAHRYMARERHEHTLQSTALVHEVYLRLVDLQEELAKSRPFLRSFGAIDASNPCGLRPLSPVCKRGGELRHVALNEAVAVFRDRRNDVVALDDALSTLARIDARKARMVELRFFGGLSIQETAEVLHVSPDTVLRDWRLAKVWLLRELSNRKEDQD